MADVSVVEKSALYWMYCLPERDAMLPPLAIAEVQSVHVPSGVAVFPALALIVNVWPLRVAT